MVERKNKLLCLLTCSKYWNSLMPSFFSKEHIVKPFIQVMANFILVLLKKSMKKDIMLNTKNTILKRSSSFIDSDQCKISNKKQKKLNLVIWLSSKFLINLKFYPMILKMLKKVKRLKLKHWNFLLKMHKFRK